MVLRARRSTSCVDLGSLEDYPTNTLDGLHRPACSSCCRAWPGTPARAACRGGFLERLHEGTWLGHVAEHVALQLQQEAGHDLRRGKTRQVKGRRGVYNVVYAYSDERVGLAAGQLAVRLINHLVRPEDGLRLPRAAGHLFLRQAERMAFGPSTAAILEEAVSRDIPWIRLNEHSLVQLGQGVHAQRIRATMTSRTGALAVDIAGDKDLTTKLLASAGLPVPAQRVGAHGRRPRSRRPTGSATRSSSSRWTATTAAACAWTSAAADAVRAAFDIAEGESRRGSVMVESFITGRDYRCLIVGGRMQAIAERVPAHVVGDGEHTVAELVDDHQRRPASRASGTRRC